VSGPVARDEEFPVTQSQLTPLQTALDRLLGDLSVMPDAETVDLRDAVGRVLSRNLRAAIDVPAADNSAMDGYAVDSGSLGEIPATLVVSQRIPAGCVGKPLRPGAAARIFTGAPLPAGADAVVMQENTRPEGRSVQILQQVTAGKMSVSEAKT
jgi:molybdopterin molybdotransferase